METLTQIKTRLAAYFKRGKQAEHSPALVRPVRDWKTLMGALFVFLCAAIFWLFVIDPALSPLSTEVSVTRKAPQFDRAAFDRTIEALRLRAGEYAQPISRTRFVDPGK